MSFKSIGLSDELHAYVVAHGSTPDPIAADLLARTGAELPAEAGMSIAPEQASFLTLLARILDVRHAVEVGTFTGMSSLAVARGMRPGGTLVCFDISTEFTDIAKEFWARAGVADRIELRIGPAAQGLKELPEQAYLDFAFIDADKEGYPAYWSELVPRMRTGGVIAVDNVLRAGRVVAPATDDGATHAIIAFNDMVLADARMESVLLPFADGITLARKR
jgi:caffeoyl-CoA O-methyltransferase